MPDIDLKSIDKFLTVAAKSGVDTAMAKHGESINAREAAALRTLSAGELKSLNSINSKLNKKLGPGTAGWICGAVC